MCVFVFHMTQLVSLSQNDFHWSKSRSQWRANITIKCMFQMKWCSRIQNWIDMSNVFLLLLLHLLLAIFEWWIFCFLRMRWGHNRKITKPKEQWNQYRDFRNISDILFSSNGRRWKRTKKAKKPKKIAHEWNNNKRKNKILNTITSAVYISTCYILCLMSCSWQTATTTTTWKITFYR